MPKQIPIAAVGHTRRSLARQQLVAVAAPSPLPQQQNPGGQLVLVEGDDGCLAEMTAPALDEVQRVGAGVLLK